MAVKADAVAMPLPSVIAVVEAEPPNVPDAPEPGAVNVTVKPGMPAPLEFVTLADSAVPNAVMIVAVWPPPAFIAIADGLMLFSVNVVVNDRYVTVIV